MALSAIFKKKKDKNNAENEIKVDEDKSNDDDNEIKQEEIKQEEIKQEEIKQEELSDADKERYNGIYPDPKKIETTMALSKRTKRVVQSVVHNVNWSGIFDTKLLPNKTNWKYNDKSIKIVEKGKDAFTIKIFSPSECKKLIELCELYGFEDCGYPKGYRNNTRLMTEDAALTNMLYQRVKSCCPQRYYDDDTEWEICGLNERVRWCKYVKGGKFGMHCDARFVRSGTEKSFYTVNVYLNDGTKDFKGGKTCFFNPNEKTFQYDISAAVTASAGLALIFNQWPERIEHNGEVVTKGIKYLMRTDVMYKDIQSRF